MPKPHYKPQGGGGGANIQQGGANAPPRPPLNAALPNLNPPIVIKTLFGAKPPNLMTTNISGYTIVASYTTIVRCLHSDCSVCVNLVGCT